MARKPKSSSYHSVEGKDSTIKIAIYACSQSLSGSSGSQYVCMVMESLLVHVHLRPLLRHADYLALQSIDSTLSWRFLAPRTWLLPLRTQNLVNI